jgi:3-isopropylmalate/(R)-2-methylmalate dehydratase small subunit
MIKDLSTGKTCPSQAFPEFMQNLIEAGGLMEYVKRKVKQ